VKRHIWFSCLVFGLYGIVNFSSTMAGRPPYGFSDFKSVKGISIAIMAMVIFVLTAFLLQFLQLKKLKRGNRSHAIVEIIEKSGK